MTMPVKDAPFLEERTADVMESVFNDPIVKKALEQLLRGTTQIRKRLDTSLLRKGCGLRGPGDFGAVRLIRLLGGCPSRCCCKGLSASWPSLWAGRKPVLLPRRRKNQNYRIVFLFFIIMRQSRSPRCNPRISISAEARFVAHGTLDESHRRSVRMMR